mgnify:CR=1 FL=1
MPFIGNQPTQGRFIELDSLSASATANYTLQLNSANYSPESVNNLLVSINGVIQGSSTMSLNGAVLSVGATLSNSDTIDFVRVFGNVGTVSTPTDGSVTANKIGTGAVTSAKIADGTIVNADINASAGIAGSKLGTDAVLQVKNHQDSEEAYTGNTIPNDDSKPQKTEGGEFMTLSITPKSASNKLFIQVVMGGANTNVNSPTIVALFKDDEADSIKAAAQYQSVATGINTVTFNHYMTAGTTSAITFKVRGGAGAGNFTFNGYNNTNRNFGGVSASSITIMEIGA